MKYRHFETPDLQTLAALSATVRRHVAQMYYRSFNGHYGGSFSCVELLVALYFGVMRLRPEAPDWPERDRFIMSKGHCAGTLYGVLAERGFFSRDWLNDYECFDCRLNTHPNMHRIPGLDISSGSLGHGLSAGVGMAIAARMDAQPRMHYVLLGDGECCEGSVWEAAMSAHKYRLDNLVALVDRNRLCVGGDTEAVMPLEPFADKWTAFGWEAHAVDGHDFRHIFAALDQILAEKNGKPKVIIADTVKGKGVSFMEDRREWHAMHVDAQTHRRIMDELTRK